MCGNKQVFGFLSDLFVASVLAVLWTNDLGEHAIAITD